MDLPKNAPEFPEMQETLDSVAETAQAAKDSATDTAQAAKDSATDTAQAAKDSATDTAQAAKDSATDTAQAAKDSAAGAVESITEAVKDSTSSATTTTDDSADTGPLSFLPAIKLPVAATKAPATARDVFMWRNPYLTGVIFGSVNIIFFLVFFFGYSLLRVFASAALLLLIIAFIGVNASKLLVGFTGKEIIPKPTLGFQYFREDVWLKHAKTAISIINHSIDIIRKAFYCVDNKQTLRFAGVLYALSLIGRFIPDMVLIYLTFLTTFTAPILYETYQTEIDVYLEKLKKLLEEYYAIGKEQVSKQTAEMQKTVGAKMEQLKTQVQEKSGPLLEKSGVASKFGLSPAPKKTE